MRNFGRRGVVATSNNPIYLITSPFVVPAMQLAEHDDSATRAALVAEIAAGPILVIEAETILAAAYWARTMLVFQEGTADAKRRKDLRPAPTSPRDRSNVMRPSLAPWHRRSGESEPTTRFPGWEEAARPV